MSPTRSTDHRVRCGFSLVELLIAILILGIGVISITAIFPAGILQQQRANDDVVGPIVAQNALGILRSKLSQDDFGTLDQFGAIDPSLFEGVVANSYSGSDFLPFDARLTISGDWPWMRPSILVDSQVIGSAAAALSPPAGAGSIDIFSARRTRASEGLGNYSFGEAGSLIATSEFPDGIAIPDVLRLADESRSLYGIPYNRAKFAFLSDIELGASRPDVNNGDPRSDPVFTISQAERAYPQGASRPEYVWDCMFRRFQGRVQVAIFVYRVSFGGGEARPYAVGPDIGNPLGGVLNDLNLPPIPVRIDLDDPDPTVRWYPRGEDPGDVRDDRTIPGTDREAGAVTALDPYAEGWQAPGQWLIDQHGTVHRVLNGRRNSREGPVELFRAPPIVPAMPAFGNPYDATGRPDSPGAVKAFWYVPTETRDGAILTPVYVSVKEL